MMDWSTKSHNLNPRACMGQPSETNLTEAKLNQSLSTSLLLPLVGEWSMISHDNFGNFINSVKIDAGKY